MVNALEQESEAGQSATAAFRGYAPPTSSTTYTPNQFFAVLLPTASRGCLRLVANLIRQALKELHVEQNAEQTELERDFARQEAKLRQRLQSLYVDKLDGEVGPEQYRSLKEKTDAELEAVLARKSGTGRAQGRS